MPFVEAYNLKKGQIIKCPVCKKKLYELIVNPINHQIIMAEHFKSIKENIPDPESCKLAICPFCNSDLFGYIGGVGIIHFFI